MTSRSSRPAGRSKPRNEAPGHSCSRGSKCTTRRTTVLLLMMVMGRIYHVIPNLVVRVVRCPRRLVPRSRRPHCRSRRRWSARRGPRRARASSETSAMLDRRDAPMRAKGVTRRRTQGASVSRGGGVPALARRQEWAGGPGEGRGRFGPAWSVVPAHRRRSEGRFLRGRERSCAAMAAVAAGTPQSIAVQLTDLGGDEPIGYRFALLAHCQASGPLLRC